MIVSLKALQKFVLKNKENIMLPLVAHVFCHLVIHAFGEKQSSERKEQRSNMTKRSVKQSVEQSENLVFVKLLF